MYQLGIIFICPPYCLLIILYFPLNTKYYFKYLGIILYFPLKTKYYFKYLGMILYLTLTVAPNSEMGCFTLVLLGSNIPSLNWPAPVSPNYFWKSKEIIM